jgi:hypothetical protein
VEFEHAAFAVVVIGPAEVAGAVEFGGAEYVEVAAAFGEGFAEEAAGGGDAFFGLAEVLSRRSGVSRRLMATGREAGP